MWFSEDHLPPLFPLSPLSFYSLIIHLPVALFPCPFHYQRKYTLNQNHIHTPPTHIYRTTETSLSTTVCFPVGHSRLSSSFHSKSIIIFWLSILWPHKHFHQESQIAYLQPAMSHAVLWFQGHCKVTPSYFLPFTLIHTSLKAKAALTNTFQYDCMTHTLLPSSCFHQSAAVEPRLYSLVCSGLEPLHYYIATEQ